MWRGESVDHWASVKVQQQGQLQVINLTFAIKAINPACCPGYWLIFFLPLAQIPLIQLRNQNSTARGCNTQRFIFFKCVMYECKTHKLRANESVCCRDKTVLLHLVWESLFNSSHITWLQASNKSIIPSLLFSSRFASFKGMPFLFSDCV